MSESGGVQSVSKDCTRGAATSTKLSTNEETASGERSKSKVTRGISTDMAGRHISDRQVQSRLAESTVSVSACHKLALRTQQWDTMASSV